MKREVWFLLDGKDTVETVDVDSDEEIKAYLVEEHMTDEILIYNVEQCIVRSLHIVRGRVGRTGRHINE
ncbi:hypothetical protein [Paenibacillus sp. FSL L8-0463]|uniref:hypothetical protein n=1 Tax=Paenibacillus sp. FSL L8-0463 TaxID=2954687 RepID=UPI00311A5378